MILLRLCFIMKSYSMLSSRSHPSSIVLAIINHPNSSSTGTKLFSSSTPVQVLSNSATQNPPVNGHPTSIRRFLRLIGGGYLYTTKRVVYYVDCPQLPFRVPMLSSTALCCPTTSRQGEVIAGRMRLPQLDCQGVLVVGSSGLRPRNSKSMASALSRTITPLRNGHA